MIFMNNLFTSYELFSVLWSYGISACGTMQANRLGSHFADEILNSNNGRLMQ